ncbi:hypothetical protein [Brevibacillus agri]|uniref:hypothetical protein n=1 Tax=Brevibacillus agri TaxID=51101 RepID=UPI003D20CC04
MSVQKTQNEKQADQLVRLAFVFLTRFVPCAKRRLLSFNNLRIPRRVSRLGLLVQVRVQLDVLADEDCVNDRSFANEHDFAQEQQADARRGDQEGAVESCFDVPPAVAQAAGEDVPWGARPALLKRFLF